MLPRRSTQQSWIVLLLIAVLLLTACGAGSAALPVTDVPTALPQESAAPQLTAAPLAFWL